MRKGKLGRREPTDFKHIEKYPLMASTIPAKPVPIVVGVNWYSNFDTPVKKGNQWWVGLGNLGSIRGGHAVVMPPTLTSSLYAWYIYYNQVNEGKCVGEAGSHLMSMVNRKRYNPTWLWNEAKKVDEWPETNPGDNNGTSIRAMLDVLRTQGHEYRGVCSTDHGICANRWLRDMEDGLTVLDNPTYRKLGAIPFHNSWGKYDPVTKEGYPRITWMPCEVWQRLLNEAGEFGVIVDK